jgi:maltooligosyltrehalose trehalohydrolase
VPGSRFVTFLQDHDQVGNRAQGDRSSALLSDGLLKVGAALLLLSPFTPMLFMGEEWGARTPWQFFSDHAGDLGEAVRVGRRSEFASHGWSTDEIPDPQDPETFRRSTLDWSEPSTERGAALLDWHRRLIALRGEEPDLAAGELSQVSCTYSDADAGAEGGFGSGAEPGERWFVLRRGSIVVVANLGTERRLVPVPGTPVGVLLASEPGFSFEDGAAELAGESVAVLRLL